ncbi:MAG: hypothetical protein ABJD24_01650 [Acidimicrobiales bacterium]
MPSSRMRIAVAVALVVIVGVGVVVLSRDRNSSSGSSSATLDVGAVAPTVRLAATSGQTVDVSAFRGKRDVLLYFYEHAG